MVMPDSHVFILLGSYLRSLPTPEIGCKLFTFLSHWSTKKAWWRSGRASHSELRGLGFDLCWGHRVVSMSRYVDSPEYWAQGYKTFFHAQLS